MNLAQYIACGEAIIAGFLPVAEISRCEWDKEAEQDKRQTKRRTLGKTHRRIIAALPRTRKIAAAELFRLSGVPTNATFVQELSWLKKIGVVTATGKPGSFQYSLDAKRMKQFEERGQ